MAALRRIPQAPLWGVENGEYSFRSILGFRPGRLLPASFAWEIHGSAASAYFLFEESSGSRESGAHQWFASEKDCIRESAHLEECPDAGQEETYMRFTFCFALAVTLAASGLHAQVTENVSLSNGVKSDSSKSDQEKNISAYIELLRRDLRKEKAQVMAAVMQLDASEAAAFWPIYKDYDAEIDKHYDGVMHLVKDYALNYVNMTPEIADGLAMRLLDLEQGRQELKRKYYLRFKSALDAITAARFLQVENQIEKVIDLQIASELPVIDRGQQ